MKEETSDEGRKCRIQVDENTVLLGYIKGGHFVMEDKISNGASWYALTHHAPDYHPIPLTDFEKHGHKIELLPGHIPTLQETLELAAKAHAGQTDKAGAPYIEHPIRVANAFAENDRDARTVALLHDALEDTFVTREFLERSGYELHVIEAIEALTKQSDEEGSDAGYEQFIRRAAQNPLARQVKISDLKDNMDLSRIAAPTAKDYARLEKYQRALAYLEALPQDGSTPGGEP